ncbi:hypothetical protein IM697_22080 [Streptomyces ferrugineus]|uniref:Uncharacterized protein n=1 Tax=Streptomyces ferrugineus TaxID=1413221 RepID=A0A7M2SYX1_9ACTN|nr:hypothetical protein [Streptomyces ferrugineus]QOV40835.1 hypothetical protein IM697_22080 [Streptomyces ferrugineus]
MRSWPSQVLGIAALCQLAAKGNSAQLGRLKLSQVPPNRMAVLARYALGSKAPLR